jgi:hypothetical protein
MREEWLEQGSFSKKKRHYTGYIHANLNLSKASANLH